MERGDRAGRSGAAVEKEGGSGIFRPVYEREAGAVGIVAGRRVSAGIVPGRHVSAELWKKLLIGGKNI